MPSSDTPPQLSEEEIFQVAAALPPNERMSYVLAACEGRPAVRGAVEQLLASIGDEGFMKRAADRSVSAELDADLARLKPEEAGERIGNYKLLEQIGEGGFGVVWVAEQEQPMRRRVALKIIKLGMNTREVIARFEQERQALAMMDHPNIAKVLEAGATPFGRPFFVMELVRGIKITEYCDQANLPTAERLRLFIAVCQAVQHAHQKGIIHRDLKPSNILVTLHDGVPVPKVIDFGVAKATQQQRLSDLTVYTQFEQMIGTPLYMSPEQAEMSGLDIDTRSDIYSLGVLLYELLVGRTPFDPQELMKAGYDEMRRVIREQEPQKPSTFLSTMALEVRTASARRRQTDSAKWLGQIRGDLDWIVMKALEKDRARRYETANGLAKDIERHLLSEPVQARPPTQLYRFRRFAKRNKIAFAAASAVLAALIIGLGISTWMFFEEKQARQRAVAAEQEQVRLRQLAVAAENAQEEGRIKAETEASKSQQVAQFLTDMLNGVGPSVALGRDTKMLREILDNTAERVGKDLQDQPEVEADLRDIIGNVYDALGEYTKGGAMEGESLAIRRKRLGNEDPKLAGVLYGLGINLWYQGKVAEAETMHREALAMRRKLLGSEHLDVALSLDNLANVLFSQGKLAEAETMHREALAMARKLLGGGDHPNMPGFLNNLAAVLQRQGKLAEAEAMNREALAMQRKLFGNEYPDVAITASNLATVLSSQGKLAEAETTQREALEMARKLMGSEHPRVASFLGGLAGILYNQGRLDEAETMHREALTMQRKLLGNEHPDVARSLNALAMLLHRQSRAANVLQRQSKLAEAETMEREALAMRRKLLGNEHPDVSESLDNLGNVLTDQGKLAEADTVLREALVMRRKLLGDEHPDVAQLLNHLAIVLQHEGKLAEADTVLREALARARRSAVDDASKVGAPLMALAEFLYRQNKYAEAEPLYREAVESDKARPKEDANRVSTVASLARLLADWAWTERGSKSKIRNPNPEIARRAQEAERLLRECLAIRLRGANPAHWRTNDVRSRLGGALVAVGVTDPALTSESRLAKFAEAESLLLEGNEALQQSQEDSKYKRDALIRLVCLYRAWNSAEKAGEWEQKLADFDKAEAARFPRPEGGKVTPRQQSRNW